MHPLKRQTYRLGILGAGLLASLLGCDNKSTDTDAGGQMPDQGSDASVTAKRAGASVYYYFYQDFGMLRCPNRVPGYNTQMACDNLGKGQTEVGGVNQVALSCDTDSQGCIVGTNLLVAATNLSPMTARSVKVTYKQTTLTLRLVDRTRANDSFKLGLDAWLDLGIFMDLGVTATGPMDITYECL
jgi:hypothetical protein